VPPPSIGRDLGQLLYSGNGADYTIAVEYASPEGGGDGGGGGGSSLAGGGGGDGPTSSQMAGGAGAVVRTGAAAAAAAAGGGGGGDEAQASGGSTGGGGGGRDGAREGGGGGGGAAGGSGAAGGGAPPVMLQEEFKVHRMVLEARSPYFRGLLGSSMAEAREGRLVIRELLPPVVRAVLHFIYTDELPEELQGPNLEAAMAQHLLVAADMYQVGAGWVPEEC
jgi:hypothetical protein